MSADDVQPSIFVDLDAIAPQTLATGYLARAVHGSRLTLAVVEVEPGGRAAGASA